MNNNIDRIFRKIAEDYGISSDEVRQEIQAAITDAYTNPLNDNEVTKEYQSRIPCRGEIPTPEELITYITDQLAKK